MSEPPRLALPPPPSYRRRRPPPPPGARHPVYSYRPSRALRTVRYLAINLLIALLVGSAYTAFWYILAANLRDRLDGWTEAWAHDGPTLEYESIRLEGFPGRIRLRVAAPRAAGGRGAGAWTWEGARLTLSSAPWTPRRVTVDLDGPQRLGGPRFGGALPFEAEVLRVAATLSGDPWPDLLDLEIAGLAGTDGGRLRIDQLDIVAERLSASPRRATRPSFRLDIAGAGLDGREIDAPVDTVALRARVRGLIPGGPLPAALAWWRGRGGTVDVEQLSVAQGVARFDAAGTLGVDDDLRPVGESTARITGLPAILERLRRAGVIRGRDATMATIILAAFAQPRDDGPPRLSVPLTAAGGTLAIGPARLLAIPDIDWAELQDSLGFLQQGPPPNEL